MERVGDERDFVELRFGAKKDYPFGSSRELSQVSGCLGATFLGSSKATLHMPYIRC